MYDEDWTSVGDLDARVRQSKIQQHSEAQETHKRFERGSTTATDGREATLETDWCIQSIKFRISPVR